MRVHAKYKSTVIIVVFGLLTVAAFGIGPIIRNQKNKLNSEASSTNFDQYCQDGVYYVQKEGKRISCGRAPNCGGRSYESVEGMDWRGNAECWVEDYYGGSRCAAYCAGNIPLCCYKLAETKNPEDCTWPERGYCLPNQCEGVGERCGQPIVSWCTSDKCVNSVNDIPYIPLTNRLSGQSAPPPSQPTNTPIPTNVPPVPTNTSVPPNPTHTTAPNQPTNTPPPTNTPVPNAPTTIPTSVPSADQPIGINPQVPTATNEPLNVDILPDLPSKQEVVVSLEKTTAKPLAVVNTTYDVVVSVDKQLESFAESWIDKLRMMIAKIFR